MTMAETRKAYVGKSYWYEYVRVNGFSVTTTRSGILKLARSLDLEPRHVAECIQLYLEA